MELKDIASVSGKPGLFKILKPTRNSIILESLDNQQKKMVAGPSTKVSVLNEISIYTMDEVGSIPLTEVFEKVHNKYGKELALPDLTQATSEELEQFLESVVENYDRERVYDSDIKKVIKWYTMILEKFPDKFKAPAKKKSKKVKK